MAQFFGQEIFKLGFGLMRLPKLENGRIDVEQTSRMVDAFLEAGGTYFDTAYVYDNGESEATIKKALVDRYPRRKYTLATKLNAFMQCHDEESAKQQFYTSLERTGAGYFDFYLLHALQRANRDLYDNYHLWDFVKELKAAGKIKHYGFSFHGDPDLLEELLNAHPDMEFVQLQINYADWENPGVASKRNLEICKAHGKPVIVMEPVKGGILADPIPTVRKILDDSGRGISPAGWAVRFVASQDNILTVLSGMSSFEQMQDNLNCMKDFTGMTEEDYEVIRKAQKALDEDQSIPCTGCHYCTDGCPMNIPIPDIFTVVNRKKGSPEFRTLREYTIVTHDRGRASDCVQCGQCESACPQHLPIIKLLEDARVELEK